MEKSTKIAAEMTACTRTGYHKYTFPQDNTYIYIDLADAFAGRKDVYIEVIVGDEMSNWPTAASSFPTAQAAVLTMYLIVL
nr:hypothetical protein [uncultured Solibaculum sp.]